MARIKVNGAYVLPYIAKAEQNPQIETDKLTSNIKEGEFEAIISTGINQFWRYAIQIFWLIAALSLIHLFFNK